MWEPKANLLHNGISEPVALTRITEIWEFIRTRRSIVTSRDHPEFVFPVDEPGMPDGFNQIQIPLLGQDNSLFFFTQIDPYSFFPEHTHVNSSVFRIVAHGKIFVCDVSLEKGDWMFVPANTPYSLETGSSGATLLHAYGQP